jgi:hypothetical protein
MRLIDRNHTPVGGFFYVVPETGDKVATSSNLESLTDLVYGYYNLKSLTIPDYLPAMIEDQICMRQPEGRCRYTKGWGDRISNVVSKVAGAIDKVAGTDLKRRARGCGGCGKRRQKLNKNAK